MPTYKDALITLAIVFSFIALSFAVADETITMTGDTGGRTISVTTNANRIAISPPARLVSVINAGSAILYVAPRVSSTEYTAMLASTNATPIPATSSIEFVGGSPIDSIVVSAASGTNVVTVSVQK